MKAIVNPQKLLNELKKVAPVISKNTILPILSSVVLSFNKNKLTIKGTDLETTIHLTMDCESKDSFDVLVEFSDLIGVCSKIHEPILINAIGDSILITSDNSKFKFAKTNEEHFPKLPEEDFLFDLEVEADFFWALGCANICKSDTDLNPRMYCTSIKVKKDLITIAGIDGFVAYRNELKIKTGKIAEILVGKKFVDMTKGFSEGKVSIGEKFIKVETSDIIITSLLFDSQFVDLDSIIPQEILYNFKTNRVEFINSLGVTGIVASVSTKTISIHFDSEGEIKLYSQNVYYGKEVQTKIKSTNSVEIKSIGVNGNQMLKLLNLFDSEEVEMAFGGEKSTIYLRPAGEPNILCLLQPAAV